MNAERHTLLIVDDTEINLDILLTVLSDDYDVGVALDGYSAVELARKLKPHLILLDIMLPGIDGFEVCRRLKADRDVAGIPVIFLTSLTQEVDEALGLELGAVDYITKPFNPALVKARIRNLLELQEHRHRLEKLVDERTSDLRATQEATVQCMAMLAEMRDAGTGEHIQRTRSYVSLMVSYLVDNPVGGREIPREDVDLLYQAAPLHDIGKVGVPDRILLKPGRLTPEEFEEMKRHTLFGGDILRRAEKELGAISFLQVAREITENHHEKWDGTGYPRGISGEAIPLSARIMAIADVYDALRSARPYKEAFSHERSVRIIREGAGSHFDPVLVDVFLQLENRFREIGENLGLGKGPRPETSDLHPVSY